MKPEIIFIHCAGPQGARQGSDCLVSLLRNELSDYIIRCPRMPSPENPRYPSWKKALQQEISIPPDKFILIGHSMGASVILKYLSEEKVHERIAGLFLVAAIFWGLPNWESEEFELRQDFAQRLPAIPFIHFYHSRDDQVVSISHMDAFAGALPLASVMELDGRGHLFAKGLPELTHDVRLLQADIEVFKTDVSNQHQAQFLIQKMNRYFTAHEINFDLEDCDHVLRVKANAIDSSAWINFLKKFGVSACVLEG